MTSRTELQPYERLRDLGNGLHVLDGDWYDTPFRRRMTVMRLTSGQLAIHSAIALKDEDYAWIEKLGEPRWILVPNRFHCSEAHVYRERYPTAHVLSSRLAIPEVARQCTVDGTLPEALPLPARSEIECIEPAGQRFLDECVFLHRPSRTLVLTDLAFNLAPARGFVQKLLYKLNRLDRGFGPSRIFETVFVRDKAEFRASLQRIVSEWDFDRIIVNHGEIVESGGKALLARAFGLHAGAKPTEVPKLKAERSRIPPH